MLKGSSSTTVTIKYSVITVARVIDNNPDDDDDMSVDEDVKPEMRTVQLNVKRVSEMPVMID